MYPFSDEHYFHFTWFIKRWIFRQLHFWGVPVIDVLFVDYIIQYPVWLWTLQKHVCTSTCYKAGYKNWRLSLWSWNDLQQNQKQYIIWVLLLSNILLVQYLYRSLHLQELVLWQRFTFAFKKYLQTNYAFLCSELNTLSKTFHCFQKRHTWVKAFSNWKPPQGGKLKRLIHTQYKQSPKVNNSSINL